MKIDAQGYEKYILDGAGEMLNSREVRGLFLEILFVDLYQDRTWGDELLSLMREKKYFLFGFVNIEQDKNGWKWADTLFLSEDYGNDTQKD